MNESMEGVLLDTIDKKYSSFDEYQDDKLNLTFDKMGG